MTDWYDSAASTTLVVRVGSSGAIETNPNPTDSGNTWSVRTSGVTENLYGITYNGALFIAVGANGTGIGSVDGILWTAVNMQTAEDLNSITSVGLIFIAVGNAGVIAQSGNGSTWTILASGVTENLWDVAIGNAVYVAVGDNDTVVTGSVISTNLEITVLEDIIVNNARDNEGTFNHTLSEDLLIDEGLTRYKNISDSYIYQFVSDGFAMNQDIVQDEGGDPQAGTDESIYGTSSPVVEEGLNVTSNDSLILSDTGDGVANFITVQERAFVTQFGAFEQGSFNKALTDTAGMSERIFDSFTKLVESLIIMESTPQAGWGLNLQDDFTLTSEELLIDIALLMVESFTLTDTPSSIGTFVLALQDDVTLNDTLTPAQVFNLIVNESLLSTASFTGISGDLYTGIVMNTTNFGNTEYQDYSFGSLGQFNKKYFGTKEDGIYLLEGDKDGAADIDAVAKTGLTRFKSMYNKRVPEAFLGLRSDGVLVLKTHTTNYTDGTVTERYNTIVQSSPSMGVKRIKMSKGVKAVYWQFELVNVDGADFTMDTMEMVPIELTRKI